MKYLLVAAVSVANMILFTSEARAQIPVIPQAVQQGITPQNAVDTFQNLFKVPEIPLPSRALKPASPQAVSIEKQVLDLGRFFAVDSALMKLNQNIRDTIGVDVFVLIRSLVRGIVWLVDQILYWVGRVIPAFSKN